MIKELILNSSPKGAYVDIGGKFAGKCPVTVKIYIPEEKGKKLLVVLGNQYSDDSAINLAIAQYENAINIEGWTVQVEKLSASVTEYSQVDEIIEKINPFATLLIGEDIPIALSAGNKEGNFVAPSLIPFYTLGGSSRYRISTKKPDRIVQQNLIMEIPTALLIGNKNEIINALTKFARNRNQTYGNTVVTFLSITGMHGHLDPADFTVLSELGRLVQYEDPVQEEVDSVLTDEYKMVVAEGHASCWNIWVRDIILIDGKHDVARFYAHTHAKGAKVPLLVLGGCGVNGWNTRPYPETVKICPPPTGRWFGRQIFDNPHLHMIVAGLENEVFLNNCVSSLAAGKSIAEAMRYKLFRGDYATLFGDPTFHY